MGKLYKGKKVVIMGLGLLGGGVATAKFFCEQGADVLVTDIKTEEQLKDSLAALKKFKIAYSLGGHKESDFEKADLIIRNPAVRLDSKYLEIARKNNIPIETDISIFFKLCPAPIIGVTGTKGKSTVASLIYEMLKTQYKSVLAGNIGVSVLESLKKIKGESKVVLELSNFELEDLNQSPHIAVITNLLPDHLNRYNSFENYIKSKEAIFKHQTEKDYLVIDSSSQEVKNFVAQAKAKIIYFSSNEGINFDINKAKIFGQHNIANLSAAIAVAKLEGVEDKNIQKAINNFKGISHRMELIAQINGVKYINDTAATMPEAVIAALNALADENIILIAGGQNKNLQYDKLIKIIKEKVKKLILLPGDSSDIIEKGIATHAKAKTMQEAVQIAFKIAQKGDIVLFSPGAASFNLFKNEFDRGEQFIKAVKKIK